MTFYRQPSYQRIVHRLSIPLEKWQKDEHVHAPLHVYMEILQCHAEVVQRSEGSRTRWCCCAVESPDLQTHTRHCKALVIGKLPTHCSGGTLKRTIRIFLLIKKILLFPWFHFIGMAYSFDILEKEKSSHTSFPIWCSLHQTGS